MNIGRAPPWSGTLHYMSALPTEDFTQGRHGHAETTSPKSGVYLSPALSVSAILCPPIAKNYAHPMRTSLSVIGMSTSVKHFLRCPR